MTPERALTMITVIADLLENLRHVAVGASSPIPAAAALLARFRSQGRTKVSILGSQRHTSFTDGGKELFDCAAQGRIDAFFLSGVQIDAEANINLLGLGTPPRLRRRFIGNFGAPYLASLVPDLILFRTDHSPKSLVGKVDFITAPGREGRWLVTDKCVMRREKDRLRLVSLHPGETLESISAATGFAIDTNHDPHITPSPDADTRELIHGPIAEAVAEIYPSFVESHLGG